MAAMGNALNANVWLPMPGFLVQDGSVGSIASLMMSNLNPQLKLGMEFCNEVWNGQYNCTGYSELYGQSVLGLPVSSDHTINGYYSLKSKQYFDNAIAAIGTSRFVGIMAAQYFGSEWPVYETYRFEGHDLCGTSCSNATYQTNIGHDYNSKPNRPVDETKLIAGAPYLSGSVCNYTTGVSNSIYRNATAQTQTSNFAALATATDDWLAGIPALPSPS